MIKEGNARANFPVDSFSFSTYRWHSPYIFLGDSMNTRTVSLRLCISVVTLFVLLQTQVLSAQDAAAPRSTATTAVAADTQIVSSPSQVVPALPVPRLIKFSAIAKDASGQPRTGTIGVTFSIYASQEGGAPLWMETQNLELDAHGHYAALLGSSQSAGMPLDLFSTGEPRWLGAKVELPGEVEQPRVLLVSVPYALKASDADTVGGMPASAFVLAPTSSGAKASGPGSPKSQEAASKGSPEFSSSGQTGYIPVFTDNSGDIADSVIYQNPSGNVGIGYSNPVSAKLVVGAPSGGPVLNASNLRDTDFFITLTTPGANPPFTQFGPSSTSNLALAVGGAPKLWIANSGHVGIGTTNPVSADLVVVSPTGGAVFNGSNAVDTDFFVSLTPPHATVPYTQFGPSVDSNLALAVGGNPYFWITNTGTVGVDTTAPDTAYSLDVEDGPAGNGGILANNQGNAGDGNGIDSYGAYLGVYGTGGVAGGLFTGSYAGSYAENGTDADFYAGAWGYEGGSTQETVGMYGYSGSIIGFGVYGQAVSASNTGQTDGDLGGYPAGVWGDTSVSTGFGSLGTADDGWAFVGYNNSPSGFSTVWFENQENSSSTDPVLFAYGSSYGGSCTIDVSGDLGCTGVVSGVVPVKGGSKKVALNGIQSPESWFEDAGSAQLASGEAVVNIESVFGETVNTGVEYHVFLTPNGDCKGLYVAQKSATSFVVRELGGGTSSIAFDYRIMAKRKGFEQARLVDKTELFSLKNRPARKTGVAAKHMPTAQEVRARILKHSHAPKPPKTRSAIQIKASALNQKR